MKNTTLSHHYLVVERALTYIHSSLPHQPSLAEISQHCAMSEHHLQRVFTQWAGVSPKQFLQSLNKTQAKVRLVAGDSVLQASNKVGLSSSSRLHDLLVTMEAVTPGEIKSAGAGMTFQWGLHPSPFGECFIAITPRGLHRLDFIENNNQCRLVNALELQWPSAKIEQSQTQTQHWAETIFTKPTDATIPDATTAKTLKLWIKGSAFQFKVWEALLRIPEGALCSYSSIAQAIGKPTAARAVGSAIGKNAIAYLIPCHRVIQALGESGHYRWGDVRKKAMIGREYGYD